MRPTVTPGGPTRCVRLAAAAAGEGDVVARCHELRLSVLQDGELILLDLQPHGASVLLRPFVWFWVGFLVAMFVLMTMLASATGTPVSDLVERFGVLALLGTGSVVLIQMIDLRRRRYILTDRRVLAMGLFGTSEMPLSAVQSVDVTSSGRERLARLGTLHFRDHHNAVQVRWDMLGRPADVREVVEDVVARYARGDFRG